MKKRVRRDYYRMIYLANDEELVKYFWWFYNHHKVNKQRAARYSLMHYYSTTAKPVPREISFAWELPYLIQNSDLEISRQFYDGEIEL